MLNTFELSDIKKVVEEVLKNQLASLAPQTEKKVTLLTRKDTAKFLRVSLPTLHDWTKTGIVKAHRIGNRILYKLDEVTLSLQEIQTSKSKRGAQC